MLSFQIAGYIEQELLVQDRLGQVEPPLPAGVPREMAEDITIRQMQLRARLNRYRAAHARCRVMKARGSECAMAAQARPFFFLLHPLLAFLLPVSHSPSFLALSTAQQSLSLTIIATNTSKSQELAELASKEICNIVRSVIEQGQRKLEARCKLFTATTAPEEVVVRIFLSCTSDFTPASGPQPFRSLFCGFSAQPTRVPRRDCDNHPVLSPAEIVFFSPRTL